MTFRIIRHSTTADASDSLDNFYHIAQGSVLPMASTLLGNTTNTLDLGSSTYKWNTLYSNSITATNVSTGSILWEKIFSSSLDSNSSSWEFSIDSGLESDIMIMCNVITSTSTTCTVDMLVNGTAGSSSLLLGYFAAGLYRSQTQTTSPYIFYLMGGTTTAETTTAINNFALIKMHIDETGRDRLITINSLSGAGDTANYNNIIFGGYFNVQNTITSISFVPSVGQLKTGSFVTILRTRS